MILSKRKQRIRKFLSYLINNKAFISLIFSLFILLLTISIWLFFPVSSSGVHYYSIGLYILLLLSITIFTSYKKDISIPIAKTVLKREYYRIKFKYNDIENYFDFDTGKKREKPMFIKVYLKILYHLILLFKSSKESFEVLKNDVFIEFNELVCEVGENRKKQPIFVRACLNVIRYFTLLFKSSKESFKVLEDDTFIEFGKLVEGEKKEEIDDKFNIIRQTIEKIKTGEKIDKISLEILEKELFKFNKLKQKRTTVFSLTAITAIIIVTVAAGLISSFLFPEVFKTRAASYGFVQTSWSGGVSADTGLHDGDLTGWVKYFSKDNISTSTPTELRLSLTDTTIWSETSDADWNTHATTSTYYLSGSIGIMKPNGLTCTTASECTSGFCIEGYCCNTACTGTCQACDVSGSEGTCTSIPVNTDPDSECSATTCIDYIYGWSSNDCVKYSGNSAGNGNCNGAGACSSVVDSCTGVGATSASCGSSGCLMACVAGSAATSYDTVGEICYTSGQNSCSASYVCNTTGTCTLTKIFFVTSTCYYGDLGGLSGADSKCQARASAAGLSGTYKAFLSTSSVDANDRLTEAARVMTNGEVLATSKTEMCNSGLDTEPDRDEFGSLWVSGSPCYGTWTGTHGTCLKVNPTGGTYCQDWTTDSELTKTYTGCPYFGQPHQAWTICSGENRCDGSTTSNPEYSRQFSLYCFQD